ncbi:hypothetical protein ACOSP7_013254 [Xanthoceras sorbifolium]
MAEINGGAFDEPSQMSIILMTLSKSFDQFKSNYRINKLQFSLTQLLNELAIFETLTKDSKKRKRSARKAKGKPKPKKA